MAVVYEEPPIRGASIVAGRVLNQLGVTGRHETNSGSASDILGSQRIGDTSRTPDAAT